MFCHKLKGYLSEPTRISKRINKHTSDIRYGSISRSKSVLNIKGKELRSNLTANNVCKACDKYFENSIQLKKHLCSYVGDKPLECKVCRKAFCKESNLKMHYRIHLQNESSSSKKSQKAFQGARYSDKYFLRHSSKNPNTFNASSNKNKSSIYPNKQFYSNVMFKRVLRSSFGGIEQKSQLKKNVDILSIDKPFSCSKCKKLFKRKDLLHKHLLVHRGNKPFACGTCKKGFKQKARLDRHLLIHTENKYFSCSKCKKLFKRKDHLDRHLLIHSGNKPFACGTCKRGFKRKAHLDRHLLIHTENKYFSCSKCKKLFTRKDHLNRHLLIHSGNKPFACGTCKKGFKQKDLLQKHFHVHSSDKPFSCYKCMKAFKYKNHLKLHNRIHSRKDAFTKKKPGKIFKNKTGVNSTQHANTTDNLILPKVSTKVSNRSCQIKTNSSAYTTEKSPSKENRDKLSNDVLDNLAHTSHTHSVSDLFECCVPEKPKEVNRQLKNQYVVALQLFEPKACLKVPLRRSCRIVNNSSTYTRKKSLSRKNNEDYNDLYALASPASNHSISDSIECCISDKKWEDNRQTDEQIRVEHAENSFNDNENLKAVLTRDNSTIDINIRKEENYKNCSDSVNQNPDDIKLNQPKSSDIVGYRVICSYCCEKFKRHGDLQRHLRVHRLSLRNTD